MTSTSPAPDENRRRHPRLPAQVQVFFLRSAGSARRSLVGTTRDVSVGGMFIATPRPLRRGQVLELEAFRLDQPDEPPVIARAVVRWRRRWCSPRGMGVELIEVAPADRDRLHGWIGGGGALDGRREDEAGRDPAAPVPAAVGGARR